MYKRLHGDYLSKEFVEEVDEFIKFASEEDHVKKYKKLKCMCNSC